MLKNYYHLYIVYLFFLFFFFFFFFFYVLIISYVISFIDMQNYCIINSNVYNICFDLQTYDRPFIQRWLNEGHRTSPQTQRLPLIVGDEVFVFFVPVL
jgi:hypothetical protein